MSTARSVLPLCWSFALLSLAACNANELAAVKTTSNRYLVTWSNPAPVAGSTVTITAQLANETNTPVPTSGRIVTWADAGGGSFGSATSITDVAGKATVSYTTSIRADVSHVVRATDDNGAIGLSVVIRTVAGPPAKYLVQPSRAVVLAGTSLSVYAYLRDANDNPVRGGGRLVTWSSTGAGGSFSAATSLTSVDGSAAVGFTASSTGGMTHVLTATDDAGIHGSTSALVTVARAEGIAAASTVVGSEHSCMLDSAGAAYCWGWNSAGQLGDGFDVDFGAPLAVFGGLKFSALAAGYSHTCGIAVGGAAYCWGNNTSGQLGDNSATRRLTAVAVAGGLSFVELTAGGAHTCGIANGGAAYCWGENSSGQLGNGTKAPSLVPLPVQGGLSFVTLSAGSNHTCGLVASGAVYCWGFNQTGQLGDGSTTSRLTPAQVVNGLVFSAVSSGDSHTCGIAKGGAAYCWGKNNFGQLGDGSTNPSLVPESVSGALALNSVSAGFSHTCGIAAGGIAYCWGYNGSGELGDGTVQSRSTPGAVGGNLTFVTIAAGGSELQASYYSLVESHTCAMTIGRVAYCWGANTQGELGNEIGAFLTIPFKVGGQL